MTPKLISDWALELRVPDPFMAPELGTRHLTGYVEDAAHRIITSEVRRVDGVLVTTASGSVYKLGAASVKYLAFLQERGTAFDPENPLAAVAKELG